METGGTPAEALHGRSQAACRTVHLQGGCRLPGIGCATLLVGICQRHLLAHINGLLHSGCWAGGQTISVTSILHSSRRACQPGTAQTATELLVLEHWGLCWWVVAAGRPARGHSQQLHCNAGAQSDSRAALHHASPAATMPWAALWARDGAGEVSYRVACRLHLVRHLCVAIPFPVGAPLGEPGAAPAAGAWFTYSAVPRRSICRPALLILGLMLAAIVVEGFEEMLRSHVGLPCFVPLLIGGGGGGKGGPR